MTKTIIVVLIIISWELCPVLLHAQFRTLNFFSLNQQHGLSDDAVTSVIADTEGYMWFGTNYGLNRYDGHEFTQFFSGADSSSLPENNIVKLFVSGEGDLWVGMNSGGICRYNNQSGAFIRYRMGNDPYSWAAGLTRDIAEDNDSILYVATSGGLFYLLPGSDEFEGIPFLGDGTPDTVLVSDRLLSPHISSICSDEEHGLWIAYEDWRLTHYNLRDNTYRHFSLQDFRKDDQQTFISSMIHYRGKLWVGSQGPGFLVFDPGKGIHKLLLGNEHLVVVGQITRSSKVDLLWLATGSGLVSYNTSTGEFSRFTYVRSDNRSMTTTSITSVFEDPNGLVWVGTFNAGVNYSFIDKPFRHIDTGLDLYYTLAEENVSAIMHDNKDNLWAGFNSGLIEFHDHDTQHKYTIPISSLDGKYGPGAIFDLFQDSQGDIYCASWQGGLQKFDRSQFRFTPVMGSKEKYFQLFDGIDIRDIEEDAEGRLWLCMHGKGVYVFDRDRESLIKYISDDQDTGTISNNWVYDICIDKEGVVWVGSAWGVSRISPRENYIRRYANYDGNLRLTSNSAHLVTEDDRGNIWIGTDYGLNLYDSEKDSFYRFDDSDGLPENHIRGLEQDTSGSYWVSTAGGIIRFDISFNTEGIPELINLYHFDKEDGLQSDNFSLSCISEDGSRNLFFGGSNGIDFFDPSDIRPVKIIPRLRIKEFELFGETVYPGSAGSPPVDKEGVILLNHRQNMIGFEYVALNYFSVNGNKYSYKLHPLHSEWIDAGNLRNLVFANLDPGRYSLSLQVSSENGLTDEARDIVEFIIKPPFWQATWFRISSIIFLMGMIVLMNSFYTSRLRNKKVQLERIVRKRTSELEEKNLELEQQSAQLKESNTLLEKRQKKIQEQSEKLRIQSKNLARANKDLNVLNTMKDKFFSIIAHDLKNPFNTMLGFTDLLIHDYDSYTDKKRQELLGHIFKSVTAAYSLLENLLHWSRSQTDRLQIKPRELLVRDILETNYTLIGPMSKSKNQRFSYVCDDHLKVWADRELLNTVLRNLLSNATKFTPEEGEVKIIVRPVEKKHILFEIRDTGMGMEQEEVENIFSIDVEKKRTGTAGEEGTGLGMILCKEFIDKMGGKIWVESSEDKGTSVYFTLPVDSVPVET